MKRILSLLTFAFLFILTENASAQAKSDTQIKRVSATRTSVKDPEFSSTLVSYNEKTKVLTFTGHVAFRNDKLQLEDAGKVVYDEITKKLVIYECKGFTFSGEVVIKDKVSKVSTVEYTIGEDILYVL